jgi:rhodanese-related sulfurtransferase
VEICALPDAVPIPLGELAERFAELDPSVEWVVYCHHGIRSAQAAQFLSRNGFTKVRNLSRGIHGWASSVDPSMPRY